MSVTSCENLLHEMLSAFAGVTGRYSKVRCKWFAGVAEELAPMATSLVGTVPMDSMPVMAKPFAARACVSKFDMVRMCGYRV